MKKIRNSEKYDKNYTASRNYLLAVFYKETFCDWFFISESFSIVAFFSKNSSKIFHKIISYRLLNPVKSIFFILYLIEVELGEVSNILILLMLVNAQSIKQSS